MPYALSDDVRLYVEDSGSGVPIVFVHDPTDVSVLVEAREPSGFCR